MEKIQEKNTMELPKIYAQSVGQAAIDLTLSVNPLGCSPRVIKALKTMRMQDISLYPDSTTLLNALAKIYNVKPEQILLGNGSEQLIKLNAQTMIQPKDRVCIEQGSFGVFAKEGIIAGGDVKLCSLDDIPSQRPKLTFIANPKTPTGELIPKKTILDIQKNINKGILVVDEANGEFITTTMVPSAVKSTNLLVLRTLSKAYGLAGIRIGCVIGPTALIKKLRERQQPFPVSQIAATPSLAAIQDQAFLEKTKTFVNRERVFLVRELNKRGFRTSTSVTNNIYVQYTDANMLIKNLNLKT